MNQTIETKGNDFEVKPSGGIVLTKQQQDFANNIGCEVICSGSGHPERGINLGLAFSKTLAKDDILKPTGVKVFFLNEHAIIEIAFDVVELVLPTKELKSELAKSVERLCHALLNDREYFYSWQSNIAVAFQDAYRNWNERMPAMASINIHEISNEAAINFLKSLLNETNKGKDNFKNLNNITEEDAIAIYDALCHISGINERPARKIALIRATLGVGGNIDPWKLSIKDWVWTIDFLRGKGYILPGIAEK